MGLCGFVYCGGSFRVYLYISVWHYIMPQEYVFNFCIHIVCQLQCSNREESNIVLHKDASTRF